MLYGAIKNQWLKSKQGKRQNKQASGLNKSRCSGKDKEDEVRRVKKIEKMGPTIAYGLYLDFRFEQTGKIQDSKTSPVTVII